MDSKSVMGIRLFQENGSLSEACGAEGQRVHMHPLFQNQWGICPFSRCRWGRRQDTSGDLPTFIIFPSSENSLL